MSHSSTLQVRGESLKSFWVCPCGAKLYPLSSRHAHEAWHRRSKAHMKSWGKDPTMSPWTKKRP